MNDWLSYVPAVLALVVAVWAVPFAVFTIRDLCEDEPSDHPVPRPRRKQ